LRASMVGWERLARTSIATKSFAGYRWPSQALPPDHECPRGAAGHHPFSVGRSPLLATTTVPPPPLGKLTHTLWVLQRF